MKSLMSSTETVASRFVTYIEELSKEQKPLDSKDICTRFTVENVVNTAFGLESECFKPGRTRYMEMSCKIFYPSVSMSFRSMIVLFLPALTKYLDVR